MIPFSILNRNYTLSGTTGHNLRPDGEISFLFLSAMVMKKGTSLIGLMMMMMIMMIMTTAMMSISSSLLCSVPAGDRSAAGEAAGVGAEAGRVRGPFEGSGRTSTEGADGVPGPAGGVGGAPAQTAGRQGPPDEGHHQQVGRRRCCRNVTLCSVLKILITFVLFAG